VFTHFGLTLEVWGARTRTRPEGEWLALPNLDTAGLPTLFAKAAALGVAAK
jgi:A/G-specific adenine glycosylase